MASGLIFALPTLQTEKMADMLDGSLLQADDNDADDDGGSVDDDSDLEVVEVDNVDVQEVKKKKKITAKMGWNWRELFRKRHKLRIKREKQCVKVSCQVLVDRDT